MQQVTSRPGADTRLHTLRSSSVVIESVGIHLKQQAALLEMDVTRTRQLIRLANRGSHSAVSFIAWLVATIAQTLKSHPDARADSAGPRHSDADPVTISLLVDRTVGNHRVTVPLTIRSADTRTLSEIEMMITRARSVPMDEAALVTGRSTGAVATIYRALPAFAREGLLQRAVKVRKRRPRATGTVLVSASGMGGRVRGWFIPTSRHPMCIGIGGVTPKALVINGAIRQSEVFHMTVVLDGSVIDKTAASRWISELVRAVENARGLSDQ